MKNTTQVAKNSCNVYESNTVTVNGALNWFMHFQSGNFYFKGAFRSVSPDIDKRDDIFGKVEQNRHVSSYSITDHYW